MIGVDQGHTVDLDTIDEGHTQELDQGQVLDLDIADLDLGQGDVGLRQDLEGEGKNIYPMVNNRILIVWRVNLIVADYFQPSVVLIKS